MIDDKIIELARKRAQIEIGEQNSSIIKEIGKIKNEMAARGALRSGMTIIRVTELCSQALANRAQLVWQTYFRFISTTGIRFSDDLASKLKSLVEYHIPEKLGDLNGFINGIIQIAGTPNLAKRQSDELKSARDHSLTKVGTEIDLFVHSLKNREESTKANSEQYTFNIYSPVGTIQTGDYAVSNITQNIDAELRQQILDVLSKIESELTKKDYQTNLSNLELVDIVKESRNELDKARPNITKLRSFLMTVSTSIQTISSLSASYEKLKQILTFFGISLP